MDALIIDIVMMSHITMPAEKVCNKDWDKYWKKARFCGGLFLFL